MIDEPSVVEQLGFIVGQQLVIFLPHKVDCGPHAGFRRPRGCANQLQKMEQPKLEDVVLHDEVHGKLHCLDLLERKEVSSCVDFAEEPGEDFYYMVGVDIVVH